MATVHKLNSKPENLHWGAFSADIDAAIEIKSGDQVIIETLSGGNNQIPDGQHDKLLPDHAGFLANNRKPILPGHILTGPVYVEGAQPGDVLEVRVIEAELRQDWAWNMIAPLKGSLPEDFSENRIIRIDLNKERGIATPPWGIELPISSKEWDSKRIYVWFEAVQGYYTTARIWAEKYAIEHPDSNNAWENWWIKKDNQDLKHIYFMGKDNIPFHTIIWPAILMGLNKSRDTDKQLHLEDNVAANEYLMLQGGQFSKSRKHGVWLPAFLERYDPDTLRYYLTINMPEGHDTDFRWEDYVERVNNELIGNYGNFVHRVLTLTNRLTNSGINPLIEFDNESDHSKFYELISSSISSAIESMERQRFKDCLLYTSPSPRDQRGARMASSA